MGAWGYGNFDNDDASDWVWELEESSDDTVLKRAFEAVSTGEYVEAPDCAVALAAAEVVAALREHPVEKLPEGVVAWVSARNATASDELLAVARRAVETILAESEMRELWEETEDFAEWQKLLQGLLVRLGAT